MFNTSTLLALGLAAAGLILLVMNRSSGSNLVVETGWKIGDIVEFNDTTSLYSHIFQGKIIGFRDNNDDGVAEEMNLKWYANGTYEEPFFDTRWWVIMPEYFSKVE